MKKGHYGDYTGNARHSRKEEMIHDRELIYDAKKQLHHADQDYKHDSPAHRALVGNQDKLPGHLKKAISDAPAQMNADLKYDPVNDRADSPIFNLNKGYTPLKNVSVVFDKTSKTTSQLGVDTSMQGMVKAAMPTSEATLGSPDTSYSDKGGINRFNLGKSITEPNKSTSTNATDSTAKLGPGESTKEASRNLSRKIGKQARTEAKLARAEAGSKKAGRIKGKLAKTNSQIGHLESKIKNAKTPKSSGGSGGSGATRSSGSRVTNNIYINSAAKMNGSPLKNVACKYTKRK
jgi:hypothetical protein